MEPQKITEYYQLTIPPEGVGNTNGELNLNELLKAIWNGKWVILLSTLIFALGAVLYSLSLPNIYRANALLAPTESSGSGGLSKMAGQLGGLAALAGVNLGANESSQTDLAVQVLQSRRFVDAFIKKHDLLVPLMAAKDWNLKSNKLILDERVYNSETQQWLREPEGLRGVKPSSQEAFDVFLKNVLVVNQNKDTGLFNISVKYYSPFLAKQWVDWLIEDINEVMRERTIKETTQNLSYLNTQLEKTAIADMRSTFYKLIEEQTKTLMLAEVQEEFIFKTIDPAVVPEIKDSPQRALICILITIIGFVLGLGIIFVRLLIAKDDINKISS